MDATVSTVDESAGPRRPQLAAAGLVQDAATKACAQDVQLRLAHRALEAEQQSVVEVRRIVETVFVEDQRVGQCADLQQTVPIRRVAREARDFQSHHEAGAAEPHIGDQSLEAAPPFWKTCRNVDWRT